MTFQLDEMSEDANSLERSARALYEVGRYGDALKVYLHMAEGDPTLDAGYLG